MLAHHSGRAIFLQAGGKELRSADGIFIAQHSHGQLDALFIGRIGGALSGLVGDADDSALGQKLIQHIHQHIHKSAGIETHIKHQSLGSVVQQLLELLGKLLVHILGEGLDAYQTDVSFQHLSLDPGGLHLFPLEGVFLLHPFPQNGEGDFAARLSFDPVAQIVKGHFSSALPIHGHQQIQRLDTGLLGRGILGDSSDYIITAVRSGGNGDAHAGIHSFPLFHHRFVFFFGEVGGPLIPSALDITLQGLIHHILFVIFSHKIFIYQLGDLFQLLVFPFHLLKVAQAGVIILRSHIKGDIEGGHHRQHQQHQGGTQGKSFLHEQGLSLR